VLAAVENEWAVWPKAFDDPPIELHFEVTTDAMSPLPASVFRARGHLFAFAADAHNFAMGDTRERTASAFLDATAVEDIPYFIYHFLDAAAFQLITSLNFTPMHGATVARDGRGVLFTGDSGAGKSSLSYACARSGWTFVSDDASHLLRRRATKRIIVGAPHHVRFRPDAPELFPELKKFTPAMRGNGKLSLQIPTVDLGITTAPSIAIDFIVLPRRVQNTLARLTILNGDAVRDYCSQWFYHWDAETLAEQERAFEAMLKGVRAYSLEYSDLEAAVYALNKIVK
jgi:hypothetical protein